MVRYVSILVTLLLLNAIPRAASAEPVTIEPLTIEPLTTGHLTLGRTLDGAVALVSKRFSLDSWLGLGGTNAYVPVESCGFGLCHPGEPFDASITLRTPYDVTGSATLDGRAFTFDASTERADLLLTLTATIAPPLELAAGFLTITAPFSLSGSFTWLDRFAYDASNPHVDFSGVGTVSMLMEYVPEGNQLYFQRADYDLTHAPEPATLLLMATGLGIVGCRRRWRG